MKGSEQELRELLDVAIRDASNAAKGLKRGYEAIALLREFPFKLSDHQYWDPDLKPWMEKREKFLEGGDAEPEGAAMKAEERIRVAVEFDAVEAEASEAIALLRKRPNPTLMKPGEERFFVAACHAWNDEVVKYLEGGGDS